MSAVHTNLGSVTQKISLAQRYIMLKMMLQNTKFLKYSHNSHFSIFNFFHVKLKQILTENSVLLLAQTIFIESLCLLSHLCL